MNERARRLWAVASGRAPLAEVSVKVGDAVSLEGSTELGVDRHVETVDRARIHVELDWDAGSAQAARVR